MLVIGGSGSGKTRFYVKPNLMQCFPTSDYPTSFVVTDPKGTLVLETGQMFQRAGYRVKILNTINFSKSMKYNPFVYIHSEKDVLKLVNTLIANTKGEGENQQKILGEVGTAVLHRTHWLHLVRGPGRGNELHHPAGNDKRQ